MHENMHKQRENEGSKILTEDEEALRSRSRNKHTVKTLLLSQGCQARDRFANFSPRSEYINRGHIFPFDHT